jgi:hypothetical protein
MKRPSAERKPVRAPTDLSDPTLLFYVRRKGNTLLGIPRLEGPGIIYSMNARFPRLFFRDQRPLNQGAI